MSLRKATTSFLDLCESTFRYNSFHVLLHEFVGLFIYVFLFHFPLPFLP